MKVDSHHYYPAVLSLEEIGDDFYWHQRNGTLSSEQVARYRKRLGGNPTRPSVSELSWQCGRLHRSPMKGERDYLSANSVGSRGVHTNYVLYPGVYEINERVSWKRMRRWWCLVAEGKIVELSEAEALAWVANASLA